MCNNNICFCREKRKIFIRDTSLIEAMNTANVLKFQTLYIYHLFLLFIQFRFEILSGMTNSVDPDQEQSDLGLHCLHMPFFQKLCCMKF